MHVFRIISSKKVNIKGGDYLNDSKRIMELAKNNNGIITTAMVVKTGLSRGVLKYLSDSGSLVRVSRGVYTLPKVWEDEFVNIQSRYKRGVYALDTALFLCGLTDRTPVRFHMFFPSTYNLLHVYYRESLREESASVWDEILSSVRWIG